jgi:hypothetical protein
MQRTEEDQERIAIIAEGCKITQAEAEEAWLKAQHVATDHLELKVQRIRELHLLQQMRKHSHVSGKDKAGNNDN